MNRYKVWYEVRYDRGTDAYEVYRNRLHSGSRYMVGSYTTQEAADAVAACLDVMRMFEYNVQPDFTEDQ